MYRQKGLKVELNQDIEQKVIEQRNSFARLFKSRYIEMLPQLIVYKNGLSTSINFLKMEVGLRSGYDCVVGRQVNGEITLMGYLNSDFSDSDPSNLFLNMGDIKKENITFIIPKKQIPSKMQEITFVDDCATGNFVVLRNKVLNFTNDFQIIEHYITELTEIAVSRFSIYMQSKIMTFFISDNNDETINQLVSKLYNGSPYAKVSNYFDPDENMFEYHSENSASMLDSLKKEYQNKISELNNMIGLNSLAVDKSSGVSDTEANSNRSFITSNANIYLSARQTPLDCLNKRFNLEITSQYNDEVASEFNQIANLKGDKIVDNTSQGVDN